MMPKVHEIEVPLLQALQSLGGKALAKDVYPVVTKGFPQLTAGDIAEQLPSGGNKWTNRIQWARQRLVERGETASGGQGVWVITPEGVSRLKAAPKQPAPSPILESAAPDFEETVDDYLSAFKMKVLQKLLDLTAVQFEEFAGALLRGYGFQKVIVTAKSGDGGIDGHGELKVGMAVMKAAFQCKKWKDAVGSKEVQTFRGAIQGQFRTGLLFCHVDVHESGTAGITKEWRRASDSFWRGPGRPDHDREGNRCPVAPGRDLRGSDRESVREVTSALAMLVSPTVGARRHEGQPALVTS